MVEGGSNLNDLLSTPRPTGEGETGLSVPGEFSLGQPFFNNGSGCCGESDNFEFEHGYLSQQIEQSSREIADEGEGSDRKIVNLWGKLPSSEYAEGYDAHVRLIAENMGLPPDTSDAELSHIDAARRMGLPDDVSVQEMTRISNERAKKEILDKIERGVIDPGDDHYYLHLIRRREQGLL